MTKEIETINYFMNGTLKYVIELSMLNGSEWTKPTVIIETPDYNKALSFFKNLKFDYDMQYVLYVTDDTEVKIKIARN